MSRYHSYLNTTQEILQQYKGEEPLASFLKKFFSQHKKYGSKDRKQISHLCYCYFRTGKMAPQLPMPERILMGLFLCSVSPDEMLKELKPGWNEKVQLSLAEKCLVAVGGYSTAGVFPWKDELSEGIEHEKFCASFFTQPDVFIRLRPSHETWVREKLAKAGLSFRDINNYCLALPAGSKADEVLALDYEAMIQDLNSQAAGELMKQAVAATPLPFISVWDACAGSGGKSIMLFDIHEQMDLTVSDTRDTILKNLKKRFDTHGISNYQSLIADLSRQAPKFMGNTKFNLVIADVPCSGSGTWGRTPEQLYFFNEEEINRYAALQQKIVSNVIPHIGSGGFLLYITCSVFKKENENMVEFIKQNFGLQLVRGEVLKGYDKKADTMFAALLQKPL